MDRMKTFLKYLLLFVGLYIIISVFSYITMLQTYKTIDKYEINTGQISTQIIESKATFVNGYIIGRLQNNTGTLIPNKYLEINLYSKNDNLMGTKYVKLENFQPNEQKEFRTNYELQGIVKYNVTVVNEIPENYQEITQSDKNKLLLFGSGLLMAYYYIPSGFLWFII